MRPTGRLHLGNYHGALRNWVELQYQYECFFFVADWHMLTTGYDETAHLQEHVHEVLIDWLAAGLNPGVATLFIQSHVPERSEERRVGKEWRSGVGRWRGEEKEAKK